MKGNNGTGNTTDRDEWETPQWLFDKLDLQYNFQFDCCAIEDNTKCDCYAIDFFKIKSVGSMCWMNPPFSKAKEMFKHFFKVVNKGIAIYRCDNMETPLWQDIILPNADWIFIPKGRIAYEGIEGKGSRFPSALIGIGVPPLKELNGTVLTLNNSGDDE